MTYLFVYVPLHLAEHYYSEGWELVALGRYHGTFSIGAWREWPL